MASPKKTSVGREKVTFAQVCNTVGASLEAHDKRRQRNKRKKSYRGKCREKHPVYAAPTA